jgi:uncharacterized protein YaaW (UPF0174 family)
MELVMNDVVSNMSRDKLLALGTLLKLYDPKKPNKNDSFQKLDDKTMVDDICREISTAGGHTIANICRKGKGVSYREIVQDVAVHLKVEFTAEDNIKKIEEKIARQVLCKFIAHLDPNQKTTIEKNLEQVAKDNGVSFVKEGGVLAALTAAQLSGFGIYLAASTMVGATSGLLGIVLPFSFYTSMSAVLSVLIGPLGWTALGLATVYKAGKPNMQKLLPVVLFIAAERNAPIKPVRTNKFLKKSILIITLGLVMLVSIVKLMSILIPALWP